MKIKKNKVLDWLGTDFDVEQIEELYDTLQDASDFWDIVQLDTMLTQAEINRFYKEFPLCKKFKRKVNQCHKCPFYQFDNGGCLNNQYNKIANFFQNPCLSNHEKVSAVMDGVLEIVFDILEDDE